MLFGAIFLENGVPKTGLSPLIDIIDMADNSVVVNDAAMSEVGQGIYKYEYAAADDTKNYTGICDSVVLTGSERYAYTGSEIEGVVNLIKTETDKIRDLHDEAFGKWILDYIAKTLTLYKADGVTVLKVFDLGDTEDTINPFISRTPQ